MIHSWIKTSMIDYPGRMAAVLFLSGCNLSCDYCHNAELIRHDSTSGTSWSEVLANLISRRHLIDAVVISGGEPTLHPSLLKIIGDLKANGFYVKLDTNGARPELIKALISESLVDYIALDVKGTSESYTAMLGGTECDFASAMEVLSILNESKSAYEVRTTLIRSEHSIERLVSLFDLHKPVRKWALQQFHHAQSNHKDIRFETYSLTEMDSLKQMLLKKGLAETIELRGTY